MAMAILAWGGGAVATLQAQAIPIDLGASAATVVSASSFYFNDDPEFDIGSNDPWKASDWSGMSGTFPNGTANTEWFTSWASAGYGDLDYTDEWIEWDFGRTYTLSKLHVWNFNEDAYTDEGIKKVDIQQWTGTAWENVATGVEWPQAPNTASYTGFDHEFVTPLTTSRIRFANLENYGSTYGVGVGEVVFYAPPLRVAEIVADPVTGNVVLRWEGGWDGMQYQVEKSVDGMTTFEPLGEAQTGREYTDIGAVQASGTAFYRVCGW